MEAIKTYMNGKYALEIRYDDYPENPFEWEDDITLCTFLRRSMSPCKMPDGAGSSYSDLIEYLGGAEEIAKDGEIILKKSKYRAFNVLKYEHSSVRYYIGEVIMITSTLVLQELFSWNMMNNLPMKI